MNGIVNLVFFQTVDGLKGINVAIGNTEPADDVTEDDLDDLTFFGDHFGSVDEDTTIKIKPDDPVKGEFVVIYVPGFGQLALADVKVYVKPTPAAPGPGEPDGPGGKLADYLLLKAQRFRE